MAEEFHLFCTYPDDQSYSEINLMYQKPQAIEFSQKQNGTVGQRTKSQKANIIPI